jgi:uncharacterized membrane protein YccF (DUF307 family)
LGYFVAEVILCITIIGIPFGKQLFKISGFVIWPFRKEIKLDFDKHPIANLIWIILFGWQMALSALFSGIFFCITIIGIPFGMQWFKLMKLSLIPFGATID